MTYIAKNSQEYDRRQIVACMDQVGQFAVGKQRYKLWRYMTFYCGKDQPSIAAELVGRAPVDNEGFLRIEEMKEGQLLVMPGFIYRKIPMTGALMAEHMKKMKYFKPRVMVEHVKDTSVGAEDLGIIDMRTKH